MFFHVLLYLIKAILKVTLYIFWKDGCLFRSIIEFRMPGLNGGLVIFFLQISWRDLVLRHAGSSRQQILSRQGIKKFLLRDFKKQLSILFCGSLLSLCPCVPHNSLCMDVMTQNRNILKYLLLANKGFIFKEKKHNIGQKLYSSVKTLAFSSRNTC